MRIQRRNNQDERRVLTGMIVDSIVLGRISSRWNVGGMFRSRWANLVGDWCVQYYLHYEKAPMSHIESLFETWAAESGSEDMISLVSKFLSSLNSEYKELKGSINTEYIIDLAGRYFNEVKIEGLIDSVQSDIDIGKSEKAGLSITNFNRVELGIGEGIDILQDTEAIKEALTYERKSLIKYPGGLGEFFGDALEREGFITFLGPEKRGKSFLLWDLAYRGMLQRKRVAFFEAGDMSKRQVMRRFMARISRHPLKPGVVKWPVGIERNEKGKALVKYKRKEFEKKLTWRRALKACTKTMRTKIKSKQTYFRLLWHPNSTLRISNIESILQDWERMNWIPDVIVIDYADILDMSYPHLEGRDCINETWKQMRRLSQKYHCLLVTATQSDSSSYSRKTIDIRNFSEDKRKTAHITGMIGINQTPKEKQRGILRLNWIVLRDGTCPVYKCVYLATCLSLANPAVVSYF